MKYAKRVESEDMKPIIYSQMKHLPENDNVIEYDSTIGGVVMDQTQEGAEESFRLEKPLPNQASALPALWCRTALFGIVKRGTRALKKTVLMNRNGIKITATGEQLNQKDLDVFLAIIKLNNRSDNGEVITSHNTIVDMIGISRCGSAINGVKSSLVRLAGMNIRVETESGRYFSGTLLTVEGDTKIDYVHVKLNPKQAWMWDGATTYINLAIRKELKSDFSKWLLGYISSKISSNVSMGKRTLEGLQGECGSEIKSPREFKRRVKQSMDELYDIGFVASWDFSGKKGNVLRFSKSYFDTDKLKDIKQARNTAELKRMGITISK